MSCVTPNIVFFLCVGLQVYRVVTELLFEHAVV